MTIDRISTRCTSVSVGVDVRSRGHLRRNRGAAASVVGPKVKSLGVDDLVLPLGAEADRGCCRDGMHVSFGLQARGAGGYERGLRSARVPGRSTTPFVVGSSLRGRCPTRAGCPHGHRWSVGLVLVSWRSVLGLLRPRACAMAWSQRHRERWGGCWTCGSGIESVLDR